ncbi:unnamed protein product [Didymodactylos carnosus]|uniref:Uncharacterized protein n=1 Tax=Didymodactylos carnosus TaxID=1234261 RepID=A0A815HGG7_9BILA|nr:unnamed protein product [Didymodactylos carnosus]CAF1354391.1 unnamed protein product [Didymodactylos carnosus]CAF3987849.1 unnamed protein product [Didymodactylos carnosus]CAF4227080.1 unnamed protein product [Didymodactylos carnosus]
MRLSRIFNSQNTAELIKVLDQQPRQQSGALVVTAATGQHRQEITKRGNVAYNKDIPPPVSGLDTAVRTDYETKIDCTITDVMKEIMARLGSTHIHVDEHVKDQQRRITDETNLVIQHIITDQHNEQSRLLKHINNKQNAVEERYQQLVEQEIERLDKEKHSQLDSLQEELNKSKEDIIKTSEHKLGSLNHQAQQTKMFILQQALEAANIKMNKLHREVQGVSIDDRLHQMQSTVDTTIKTNSKTPG